MKTTLAILALAASAFLVQAQTTNVIFSITVEEPTRTNVLSAPLTQLHILGLSLAWQQAMANGVTNAFRVHVRQEVRDRLESLRTEGKAHELKTAKVDAITTSILANWEAATPADRQLLIDWINKYPVTNP